eukprot:4013347-Pyramimonas_sp.AAC.1
MTGRNESAWAFFTRASQSYSTPNAGALCGLCFVLPMISCLANVARAHMPPSPRQQELAALALPVA